MTTPYIGNSSNITPGAPISLDVMADGDELDATNLDAAPEGAADMLAYLLQQQLLSAALTLLQSSTPSAINWAGPVGFQPNAGGIVAPRNMLALGSSGVTAYGDTVGVWTAGATLGSVNWKQGASNGTTSVIVGNNGASTANIQSSTNGNTWTARTGAVAEPLASVAYSSALSLFCAVGSVGSIQTSPDGATWTARTSGTTNGLGSVIWADGPALFMAMEASSGTHYYTSPDGITWTQRTLPGGGVGGGSISAMASSSSLGLVFVGDGSAGKIWSSSDGINWTARFTSFGGLQLFFAAHSGMVLACADDYAAISFDGINWTARTFTGPGAPSPLPVACLSGTFFFVNAGSTTHAVSSALVHP